MRACCRAIQRGVPARAAVQKCNNVRASDAREASKVLPHHRQRVITSSDHHPCKAMRLSSERGDLGVKNSEKTPKSQWNSRNPGNLKYGSEFGSHIYTIVPYRCLPFRFSTNRRRRGALSPSPPSSPIPSPPHRLRSATASKCRIQRLVT